MKDVHPAQFIVRKESYEQIEGYPEACAELTGELLRVSPGHFPQVYDFLSDAIRKSPFLNRDWRANVRKGFAVTRPDGKLHTDLTHKYAGEYQEMRDAYGDEADVQFTHPHWDEKHPVALSRIELGTGGNAIHHPPVGSEDFMDEHRWSSICQSYDAAMDGRKTPAEREKASLTCYAILSHDCPHIRGSSMLARIVLEYLSQQVGFTVPLAKPEVDFNTKAITRPVDQFITEWNNKDYFDTQTTPDAVMAWHRDKIVCKAPMSHATP